MCFHKRNIISYQTVSEASEMCLLLRYHSSYSTDPFHIVTPLIKSNAMTKMLSSSTFLRNVYLNLENVQPSGSFKI